MRIALGLALLGAGCIYACGSSSSSTPGGSAGADVGAAGDNSGAGTGAGTSSGGKGNSNAGSGNGTSTGDAGEGGAAGAPVVVVISTATPHAASGLVAGGVVAHSAHFTGVFTLGEAPGGNRIMTSANSQLRGGVIGASQK
jgi:hypothetical protein